MLTGNKPQLPQPYLRDVYSYRVIREMLNLINSCGEVVIEASNFRDTLVQLSWPGRQTSRHRYERREDDNDNTEVESTDQSMSHLVRYKGGISA